MNLYMEGKLKSRKGNRWRDYDYAQDGWYFVTICVKDREKCLGKIENNKMVLNKNGKIVEKCWQDLSDHYVNCVLDEWIIMPNHVHGIVVIDNDVIATDVSVGTVGTGFKHVGTGFKHVGTGFKHVGTGFKHVGTGFKPVPTPTPPTSPTPKRHSLSEIMRGFKTFSSRHINENNPANIFHWQRSFYDHVIRDENSLNHIRQYIRDNPAKWAQDRNNKENLFL